MCDVRNIVCGKQNSEAKKTRCTVRPRVCDPETECPCPSRDFFAVETPKNQCVLRLEGETVKESENELTGPNCCSCGDTLKFVGLNGVKVGVQGAGTQCRITISGEEYQEMLNDAFCFCDAVQSISFPLPYGKTIEEYTTELQDTFFSNDFILNICSSDCVTGTTLTEDFKDQVIKLLDEHCESISYLHEDFEQWCSGMTVSPTATTFFPGGKGDFIDALNNFSCIF